MEAPVCYVCGESITKNPLPIGQGLYRHRVLCQPGAERYMQNRWLAWEFNALLGRETEPMKKDQIRLGGVYAAKVSDSVVPVRLDKESAHGGWDGTNLKTGKAVRIKSAQRLRYECDKDGKPLPVKLPPAAPKAPTTNVGAKVESKAAPKSKDAKGQKKPPRANVGGPGKMGGLDAAAKVLGEAGEALNCREITKRAFEKGYWSSDGKTPHATVYSAILREIQAKGDQARFRKAARGKFELAK